MFIYSGDENINRQPVHFSTPAKNETSEYSTAQQNIMQCWKSLILLELKPITLRPGLRIGFEDI